MTAGSTRDVADGDPSPTPDGERRASRRFAACERIDVLSVRVRPGIAATLVDLSRNGAAIDAERRLTPGRFVHVQFVFVHSASTVRGRVVRSQVAQLTAGRLVYRCAVHFDRPA